jgi:hypothetical protein
LDLEDNNRSLARLTLFEKDADYEAFERVPEEARERIPLRIHAYTAIRNYWHVIVWLQGDLQLPNPSLRNFSDALFARVGDPITAKFTDGVMCRALL